MAKQKLIRALVIFFLTTIVAACAEPQTVRTANPVTGQTPEKLQPYIPGCPPGWAPNPNGVCLDGHAYPHY